MQVLRAFCFSAVRRLCSRRSARCVSAFAGKNDSTASSCSVTSTGVPKMVMVLMKLSVPRSVCNSKGTAMGLGWAGERLSSANGRLAISS
jgi:hypothetical protein